MEEFILQFFEKIRNPICTFISSTFTLFGETIFLIALISIIYWIIDKRTGEQLVLVTLSSMTMNTFLKGVVSRPRPYAQGIVSRLEIDNPIVSTVNLDKNMSFPSGHSQMSAGIFYTGAFRINKLWAWILAPLLTLMVMISRLYFGVHFPSDVLAGMALGIIYSMIWAFIYYKFYNQRFYISIAFSILSIILIFISPNKSLVELSGCSCAASIAIPIENKYINFEIKKGILNKFLRVMIGFASIILIFILFSFINYNILWLKWIKYFTLVIIASLFVPFLFKKLKI